MGCFLPGPPRGTLPTKGMLSQVFTGQRTFSVQLPPLAEPPALGQGPGSASWSSYQKVSKSELWLHSCTQQISTEGLPGAKSPRWGGCCREGLQNAGAALKTPPRARMWVRGLRECPGDWAGLTLPLWLLDYRDQGKSEERWGSLGSRGR